MRPGGGKAKGSDFERKICVAMSLWLTSGGRTDLFNRNVLSGGRFTIMHGKGDAGAPGDLAASHPIAHNFLEHLLIECKHYRSLKLDELLLKGMSRSFLGQISLKAEKQARLTGRHSIVIAQQNRAQPLMLMGPLLGKAILAAFPGMRRITLHYHLLHSGSVYLFMLEDVLGLVSPSAFLEALKCSSPPTGISLTD